MAGHCSGMPSSWPPSASPSFCLAYCVNQFLQIFSPILFLFSFACPLVSSSRPWTGQFYLTHTQTTSPLQDGQLQLQHHQPRLLNVEASPGRQKIKPPDVVQQNIESISPSGQTHSGAPTSRVQMPARPKDNCKCVSVNLC